MTRPIEDRYRQILEAIEPHIESEAASEKHQKIIRTLNTTFGLLNSLISSLETDLELFDFADDDEDKRMSWAPIACRDAAINLWNFGAALDGALKSYDGCASIHTPDRSRALEDARKRFSVSFPHIKTIRDRTAHAAGRISGQGRKPSGPIQVHNSSAGRSILHTDGEIEVSFELSQETITTLREIRRSVFKAFS